MRGTDRSLRRLFAAFFKCCKSSQGLHIYICIYGSKNHRFELSGNQKRRRFVTPLFARSEKITNTVVRSSAFPATAKAEDSWLRTKHSAWRERNELRFVFRFFSWKLVWNSNWERDKKEIVKLSSVFSWAMVDWGIIAFCFHAAPTFPKKQTHKSFLPYRHHCAYVQLFAAFHNSSKSHAVEIKSFTVVFFLPSFSFLSKDFGTVWQPHFT